MRRIPRIQRLRAVPSLSSASLQTRCLSTTPVRPFRTTRCRLEEDKRREVLEALERDRQSLLELQQQSAAYLESPAEEEEVDPAALGRTAVPPDLTVAPVPQAVEGEYVPAASADELESVGGLKDWWDQDGNWGPADELYVFARRKVEDAGVREVLLRQAVVECLAVLGKHGEEALGAHWAFDRQGALRAAEVQVEVGENGDVKLTGDLDALVEGLEMRENEEGQSAEEAREVEQEEVVDEVVEINDELEEKIALEDALITPEEAHGLLTSWGREWGKIPLANPQLKFAVYKRVYQLTGHRIHDFAVAISKQVHNMGWHLTRPPVAKKLVDEIIRRDELLQLPNVKVYDRRVTPIDKEIWQGRWKVIEDELKKRDLPITGKGEHDKHREKQWLMGKA